jgi:hypothetical protein
MSKERINVDTLMSEMIAEVLRLNVPPGSFERDEYYRTAAPLLAWEVERLRKKNTLLNRRCQTLEAGIAEKVREAPGQSFGRALANAAATASQAEVERLQLRCRRLLRALRVFWRGYADAPPLPRDELVTYLMTPQAVALAKAALDENAEEPDEAV